MLLASVRSASIAAAAVLLAACSTADIRQAVRDIDDIWGQQNGSYLATEGRRIVDATPYQALVALERTARQLGFRIDWGGPESGQFQASAPAPLPLSQQEWQRVEREDTPKAQAIAARSVGPLSLAFSFNVKDVYVVANVRASEIEDVGTEVTVDLGLRVPPDLVSSTEVPPTATQIGIRKLWHTFDREIAAVVAQDLKPSRPEEPRSRSAQALLGRAEEQQSHKTSGEEVENARKELEEERRKRREAEERLAALEEERETKEQPRSGTRIVSTGTGFFVNQSGSILTNHHVVDGCQSISVKLVGGTSISATVAAMSPENDLALVQAEVRPESFARFRPPQSPAQMGEEVIAFGFPLMGLLSSQGNLTRGDITATTGLRDDIRFLQISAPIQPGNSGGPLLDSAGRVVGIVTAKPTASGCRTTFMTMSRRATS